MYVDTFLKTAERELAPYCKEIGLVVYSAVDTLRPNPIVFWGFNPGQDPKITDPTHWTIAEALRRFPDQAESLLAQEWPVAGGGTQNQEDGTTVYRRKFPAGGAPYQRGIRYLFSAIRHSEEDKTLPDPLVTNFLFLQTATAKHASVLPNIDDIVKRCWHVHEQIFRIARPKVLITSAGVLEYVRRFGLMPLKPTNEPPIPSGYFNWRCKKWRTTVEHGEMTVLQMPHMSYWGRCIEKERSKDAVAWMVKMVRNARTES